MYERVLFLLLDALVRCILQVGVDSTVMKTRYAPVRAHTAVQRSSEID